jgi:transposase
MELAYEVFNDNLNTKEWLKPIFKNVKQCAVLEMNKNYQQFNGNIDFKKKKKTKNSYFQMEQGNVKSQIVSRNNKEIRKLQIMNLKYFKYFRGRKKKQDKIIDDWLENPKDCSIQKNRFGDYYLILGLYKGEECFLTYDGKRKRTTIDKAKRFKKRFKKQYNEIGIEKTQIEPDSSIPDRIASIDPGIRDFYTVCDVNKSEYYSIGVDGCDTINQKMEEMRKEKRQWMRIKLRKKIQNMKDEFIHKTTSWLTNNYDLIMIPKLKKSQMVKKCNGRLLRTKVINQMHTLGHYKALLELKNKCSLKKKKLMIVTEECTTKTCGNCGFKNNNVGGQKEWKCPSCEEIILRDINSSRLIAIKNIANVF